MARQEAGLRIAAASGVIFSTSTLTCAGSFGTSYLDLTFYGNMPKILKETGTGTYCLMATGILRGAHHVVGFEGSGGSMRIGAPNH